MKYFPLYFDEELKWPICSTLVQKDHLIRPVQGGAGDKRALIE